MPANTKQNALEAVMRGTARVPVRVERSLEFLAGAVANAKEEIAAAERGLLQAGAEELRTTAAVSSGGTSSLASHPGVLEAMDDAKASWTDTFGGGKRSEEAFARTATNVARGQPAVAAQVAEAGTASAVATQNAPRIERPVTPAGRRKQKSKLQAAKAAREAAPPKAKINALRPPPSAVGGGTVGAALGDAGVATPPREGKLRSGGRRGVTPLGGRAPVVVPGAAVPGAARQGPSGVIRPVVQASAAARGAADTASVGDIRVGQIGAVREVDGSLHRVRVTGTEGGMAKVEFLDQGGKTGRFLPSSILSEEALPSTGKRGRGAVKTQDELLQESRARGGRLSRQGTTSVSGTKAAEGIRPVVQASEAAQGAARSAAGGATVRAGGAGLGAIFGSKIVDFGITRQDVSGFISRMSVEDPDRILAKLLSWQEAGALPSIVENVKRYGKPEQVKKLNILLDAAKQAGRAGEITGGLDALIFATGGETGVAELAGVRQAIKEAKEFAGSSTSKWRTQLKILVKEHGIAKINAAGILTGAGEEAGFLTGRLALTSEQAKATDKVITNSLELDRKLNQPATPSRTPTAAERATQVQESERAAAQAARGQAPEAAATRQAGPPEARQAGRAARRARVVEGTGLGAMPDRPSDLRKITKTVTETAGKGSKFLKALGPISWALLGFDIMMRIKEKGDHTRSEMAALQGGSLNSAAMVGQQGGLEQLMALEKMDRGLEGQQALQDVATMSQLRRSDFELDEILRGDQAFVDELARIM